MTYQLDADSELPPHLLELFLRSTPAQLRQLVESCQARDAETARDHAHKLKGSLYAAGGSRLADGVEVLRGSLARGDWPAALRQLQVIRDDFAAMRSELERQMQPGKP